MDQSIKVIHEKVKQASVFAQALKQEIGRVIVGQEYLVERMLIGLLADGHVLLEGVPGLAKTLAVRSLSKAIDTQFQRVQFTPDLLPADLLGTQIYNPKDSAFTVKKGPIFTNLLLADEINRAPSKVQSALLEAMQEHQVTIGEQTFRLAEPFLVLATQNPIEQEGTYPLPEAQVDRFMLKLKVNYPTRDEERLIMDRMTTGKSVDIKPVVHPREILAARDIVNEIYVDEKLKNYILDLVFASRYPEKFKLDSLKPLIAYGGSPRATICMTQAAKAYAFLQGRGYVTPEDVKSIGADVLRHRILLTYEAEAENTTSEDIVTKLFAAVEVP
jgi:MoxR-like ATPase